MVEDCLLLLLNLLKNNSSNQNFFREGSHIKYLTPFFDLESDQNRSQGGWSAQKVTNVHLMLQVGIFSNISKLGKKTPKFHWEKGRN